MDFTKCICSTRQTLMKKKRQDDLQSLQWFILWDSAVKKSRQAQLTSTTTYHQCYTSISQDFHVYKLCSPSPSPVHSSLHAVSATTDEPPLSRFRENPLDYTRHGPSFFPGGAVPHQRHFSPKFVLHSMPKTNSYTKRPFLKCLLVRFLQGDVFLHLCCNQSLTG